MKPVIRGMDQEIDEIVDTVIRRIGKSIEYIDDTMILHHPKNDKTYILRINDICYIGSDIHSKEILVWFMRKNSHSDTSISLRIPFSNKNFSPSIFTKLSLKIRHNLVKIIFKHKRKTSDDFQDKMLKHLASIEDKLQAIVYAPDSSLFREIKAERDKLVEKVA